MVKLMKSKEEKEMERRMQVKQGRRKAERHIANQKKQVQKYWELAKKAFLLFVAAYISISNLIYGSVAAIMAFLLWAYFSGLIFLFGAFVSVAYHRLKQQRQAAADPRP